MHIRILINANFHIKPQSSMQFEYIPIKKTTFTKENQDLQLKKKQKKRHAIKSVKESYVWEKIVRLV